MCHYVAIGPAAIVRGVRFVGGVDVRRVLRGAEGGLYVRAGCPQPMTVIRWWPA